MGRLEFTCRMLSKEQSSLSLESLARRGFLEGVNPQSGPWSRNQPGEEKRKVTLGRGLECRRKGKAACRSKGFEGKFQKFLLNSRNSFYP